MQTLGFYSQCDVMCVNSLLGMLWISLSLNKSYYTEITHTTAVVQFSLLCDKISLCQIKVIWRMKAHSISWVPEIQINIMHSMKSQNLEAEIPKSGKKNIQDYIFSSQTPRPYNKNPWLLYLGPTARTRSDTWLKAFCTGVLPFQIRADLPRFHGNLGTGWHTIIAYINEGNHDT